MAVLKRTYVNGVTIGIALDGKVVFLHDAEAKVERLREALAFYADEANWTRQPNPRASEPYQMWTLNKAIVVDNGRRAREALDG